LKNSKVCFKGALSKFFEFTNTNFRLILNLLEKFKKMHAREEIWAK